MADASTEPPAPWGLPSLDDDTLASVVEAVQADGRSAADVAAMATTCAAMATALEKGSRAVAAAASTECREHANLLAGDGWAALPSACSAACEAGALA